MIFDPVYYAIAKSIGWGTTLDILSLILIAMIFAILSITKIFTVKELFQMLKIASKKKKYCGVWIKPNNIYLTGDLQGGAVVVKYRNKKYAFFPKRLSYMFGMNCLEVWEDKGIPMPQDTERELQKLRENAGWDKTYDYIKALKHLRELKEKELDDGLEEEEEQYLNSLEQSIKDFEEKYNVALSKAIVAYEENEQEMVGEEYILNILSKDIIAYEENEQEQDENEEKENIKDAILSNLSKLKQKQKEKKYILKEQYFLTPINYDIIKEYYLTTNPVSMNMYAENLAHAMMKMFKDSSIKYITYAGVFLVFAAIAYVIITQNPDLVSQANAVVGQ